LERDGVAYNVYEGSRLTGRTNEDKVISASLVLVNRMGFLNGLYLAGDLAFVGGTLAELGGHNILEPVWAGTPVLFGPHLDNVREAAVYITEAGFGARVESSEELREIIELVYTGKKVFKVKTKTDIENSPTARIGGYVMEHLSRG
jgi:3-deoxy-D-manno-octulosonic-acid transferase